MFKSYLKLALRNIWKRKVTTAINVLSLAVGLASCALVVLFFQHELSYDKGFERGEDIYRVTSIFKEGQAPTTAFPFAEWVKNEVPQIEQVSRLDATNGSSIVQVAGNGTPTPYTIYSGYWVDPHFFDILSFHFLHGNRASAFNAPNTVVISQSLAKKLFGDAYPIGKPLKINSNQYTVSGVFKEDFLNHLQADFLALNDVKNVHQRSVQAINWAVDPNYYTYVKLKHGSNVSEVIKQLNAYTQRHAGVAMKAANDNVTISLQPLSSIHLHSIIYQDYLQYKQGNIQYLYLLGCIALVILALGCVNYVNLTTAQAVGRAREVGVRRVMGATKSAVRYQFLLETLAVSLLAMVVAIFFALLFLPKFNGLTGQSLSFFAAENRSLIVWFLVITLITGLVAKVNGGSMAEAITYAGQKWKEVNPDTPFSYDFLNDIFQSDYKQDQNEQQLSGIFTFIAISIGCLGLLGLITYTVNQKAREIGIRKVIGASVSNVVMLFTGQYIKLIVVANIIAAPLAWCLMHSWLKDFPYKVAISWWMFAASLAAGVITCFATIAFKTIKAAMANPVNSLRAE